MPRLPVITQILCTPDACFANHVVWMHTWMENIDLRRITLFCQDGGSLIGLRLAAQSPDRFERIVLPNGGLRARAQ